MNPGGTNQQRPTGDATALGTLTQILAHVRSTAAKYDQQATVLTTLAHVVTTAVNVYTDQARQSPPAAPVGGGSPAGGGNPAEAVAAATKPLGTLAVVLGAVGKASAATASVLVGFPKAIVAAETALVGLGQSMLGFVARANPAAAQRFQMAVDDLLASIGNFLLPVFELVTAAVRQVGDAFTLLIPAGASLAAALQPIFEMIGEALAGAVGYLAAALKAIVPVIGVLVRVVMDAVNWVGRLVKEFLGLLGIDLSPDAAPKGASVGMAARPAQIGGVEDVLKRAMTSAFGSGVGGNDPATRTASAAAEIRDLTAKFYKFVKDELPPMIEKWFTDLPGNLATILRTGVSSAASAIQEAAPNTAAGARFGPLGAVAGYQVDSLRWLDKKFGTGLFE